jgi:hypothetical protein
MNEDRLNTLFQKIREEKAETSVQEVSKWIALSAASVGLFGLLSQFKLPILLTKKLIIMTSIALSIGIGATALFLSMNTNSVEQTQSSKTTRNSVANQQKVVYKEQSVIAQINSEIPEKLIAENKIEEAKTNLVSIDKIAFRQPSNFSGFQNEPPSTLNQVSPVQISKTQKGTELKVGKFDQVHVSGALDVYISQGDVASVILEGTDKEIEKIEATVNRGELHLRQKGNTTTNDSQLKIYITMVEITGFGVSGASSISSTMVLNAPEMDVQGTGAGNIELELTSSHIKIEGTGAANIKLKGSTNTLDVEATGACNIACFTLEAKEVDLVATGAANVECKAKERLFVSATGASHVSYKGNPINISKQVSTAAKVSMRI